MTFDLDLNDYAESIRERVAKAKKGNEDAARFLLQEFVHNAGCFRHGDLQASDGIVLDFIVGAIRDILKDVDPKKALCLSSSKRGNRPKGTLSRDVNLSFDVLAELEKLRAGEDEIVGGATKQAQKRIATRYRVTPSLVRSVWEDYGGEKGVRKLRDEAGWKPDPKRIKKRNK